MNPGKKLTLLFLLFSFIAFSQPPNGGGRGPGQSGFKGTVTGTIKDTKSGLPLEYVSVIIMSMPDSSMVSGNVTDVRGKFIIDITKKGVFILRADFIGYKRSFSKQFNLDEKNSIVDMGTIQLAGEAQALEAVEITKEKSQYQVGIDKKVFNVGKDVASTGGSASDILQNVPSVTVDMDGNVALRGSGNVRVLIDGKPSGMTASGKADILERIPASMIESIEIITNPSAKYDAEGMAGIINIITKKEKRKGFNGLVSVNAGTKDKYNGSLNLNYSTGKVNFFAGYDPRVHHMNVTGKHNRKTIFSDSVSYLNQVNEMRRKNTGHTFRGGFDINLNPMNSLPCCRNNFL